MEVVGEPDPLARATALRDRMQQIAQFAEAGLRRRALELGVSAEGVRCEVQEQFANEKYVLFTYERLRDVRIAYVPPRSLGGFGGDADNFEWPRHSADFALLRAYVAPDGSPADYSPDNVPYEPPAHIPLAPGGAEAGDFVFLLGFPGQTTRYAPTARLDYNCRARGRVRRFRAGAVEPGVAAAAAGPRPGPAAAPRTRLGPSAVVAVAPRPVRTIRATSWRRRDPFGRSALRRGGAATRTRDPRRGAADPLRTVAAVAPRPKPMVLAAPRPREYLRVPTQSRRYEHRSC